ncbi:hypothetical protein [Nocardioides sp. SR21]|uniref:hypothetical protein n=1 Tax=Nocardioides sp. SR21 TaxID=2919501 RepID=UPI001FAA9095|nr:hypothetical protein [Nocardioides sp. SR21]
MHVGPLPLARRTALTLGAVAIVTSGCDDGDKSDPAGAPSATPAPDPDVALVDAVLVDLARAERLALAAGLPGLAVLHREHIEALDGPEEVAGGTAVATTEAVRRTEQRLQKRLVQASVAAESGALARLLASMSAAVSQRLPRGLA